MSEFFEQLCSVIASEELHRRGSLANSDEVSRFFADTVSVPPSSSALPRPENIIRQTPAAANADTAAPAAVSADPPIQGAGISADLPTAISSASLDELRSAVLSCRGCQLCRTRSNAVFGEGDPNAELMFIGEGPGFDEDRLGRPFVGKAGQLLDKMIGAMQFAREDVYIANIVKCRPPDNRVPTPEEAEVCKKYLIRQIELVRPAVIVLLGATAVKYLLGTTSGISRLRGRWLSYENIPVMPTFHPAFLLRQESAKREAWQDLQLVMARFGKYHKPRSGAR